MEVLIMENFEFKAEYKEITGRDFTSADMAKEIDIFIDKIKLSDSVTNFDSEIIQEILTCIKRSFYGVQISVNVKKLDKAVDVLKKISTFESVAKEDSDLCNFFIKIIQSSINEIKSAKDKTAWKRSVNRESWKK